MSRKELKIKTGDFMNDVCKGKLEICPIDSFAKLDELINVEKVKKETAFKKVAEEWNATHPDAVVKWESLKKSYNRASKPTKEFRDNVPKVVKANSGTMSRNKESFNETFLDEIDSLKHQLDKALAENTLLNNAIVECVDNERKLLEKIELLTLHISKLEDKETPAPQPQKNMLLTRKEMYEAIAKWGNEFQVMILKGDNVPNIRLYQVFCGVRAAAFSKVPPSGIPERLRKATGCVDDSENV